jgi:hypothetical protein
LDWSVMRDSEKSPMNSARLRKPSTASKARCCFPWIPARCAVRT